MVVVALADRLEKWWAARTAADRRPRCRPDARDDDPRAERDPRAGDRPRRTRFEQALAAAARAALAVADAGGVHADDARAGSGAGRARPSG